MSTWLKALVITIGVLALGAVAFFAGSLVTRAMAANGPNAQAGVQRWGMQVFGPGMMSREGRQEFRQGRQGQGGWDDQQGGQFGPGDMPGQGMMFGRGYGNARNAQAAATPLTVEIAKTAADAYLKDLNNSDLQVSDIMVFDNNAYVAVTEKSTGVGAFELLVDPDSQTAFPEMGPNMMWNLKYAGLNHANMMAGHMGRGMHGLSSDVPADLKVDMTVTSAQAIEKAQAYLDANIKGARAAADAMPFYGYYTIDYTVDGKPAGMLSVNGFSGQIFLHTWHGAFVAEQAY